MKQYLLRFTAGIISAVIIVLFSVIIFNMGNKNEEVVKMEELFPLVDRVIVIDPGHGINNDSSYEAIAPGSDKTKPAFVSGTHGKNQTEEQFNLALSLMLRDKLESMGAKVHMTREGHESVRSNIERAELANSLNADISVKIHADGNLDSSVYGISMLVPATDSTVSSDVYEKSFLAGKLVLDKVIEKCGAKNNGISPRNDMTGFNWSEVPVILLECGFMTNPEEDLLLETYSYKEKIANGIAEGLVLYFDWTDAE